MGTGRLSECIVRGNCSVTIERLWYHDADDDDDGDDPHWYVCVHYHYQLQDYSILSAHNKQFIINV